MAGGLRGQQGWPSCRGGSPGCSQSSCAGIAGECRIPAPIVTGLQSAEGDCCGSFLISSDRSCFWRLCPDPAVRHWVTKNSFVSPAFTFVSAVQIPH